MTRKEKIEQELLENQGMNTSEIKELSDKLVKLSDEDRLVEILNVIDNYVMSVELELVLKNYKDILLKIRMANKI